MTCERKKSQNKAERKKRICKTYTFRIQSGTGRIFCECCWQKEILVAVGPINTPVSSKLVQDIVKECKESLKIDVLGFDYEMGLDFSQYRRSRD